MSRSTWMALAACVGCWLTAVPAARAIPVRCDKSSRDVGLAVIHANGVFTTLEGARGSLEKLRPLVDAKLEENPYTFTYGIAYNQKKGFLASVYKLIRERIAMSTSAAVRILNGTSPVPASLRKEMARFAAELDQAGFAKDISLEKHVATYRDHLRGGRKVVVIAHSEGNFYANAAFQRLFETSQPTPGRNSFGIVGIALPAPNVYDLDPPICPPLGCYTTFSEDLVVQFVHANFPETAPPNMTGALLVAGTSDLGWHGLDESYLEVEAAREQILDHVASLVAAFEPLAKVDNDNELTATLEWDSNADLDLHVFEQFKRDHVFTDHKDGFGALDRDDEDGWGPEHYNTTCDALEDGDFRFAVGYFAGDGPEHARLLIKVGTAVRLFEPTFAEPLGEHSLLHPQDVAAVRVLNRGTRLNAQNELIDDYDIEITTSSVRN